MSAAPRAALTIAPSRLGFGCASLGSRVSAVAGLDALAQAFDAGVNWFDVAPAYGAGEAERLLGRFLKGRRDRAIVVTKVGIAPPERLGAIKLAYTLGRPLAARFAGLRRGFRALSATRNRHLPLTAALIERSIEDSLRRLGVDHIDIYALHDPDPADVARDDVREALQRVRARGQARAVAVAGRLEACRAALSVEAPYAMLQTSVADLAEGEPAFSTSDALIVSHSVFGAAGSGFARLADRLGRAPDRHRRLIAAGYDADPSRAAAALLLDSALAGNPDGVVLASMFDPRHRVADLARAEKPAGPEALALLAETLA
ncbi:MAG: aldo/keto reductase [Bradyrhizobium sp.]|nr:MAG: aldo/keto reductase [Bradyrhizobium sp.]